MTEKEKRSGDAEDAEIETDTSASEAEREDPVALANKAADEMKELAQRVQAEFDNYRKRNNEAVGDARRDGENAVLRELFRVTDNFERAIGQVDEKSKEGVNLIFKQILSIFDKFDAKEIEADGKAFDPKEHNAVMIVEDGENAGKVVEVLQKGYRRKDRILREAMVKVAK